MNINRIALATVCTITIYRFPSAVDYGFATRANTFVSPISSVRSVLGDVFSVRVSMGGFTGEILEGHVRPRICISSELRRGKPPGNRHGVDVSLYSRQGSRAQMSSKHYHQVLDPAYTGGYRVNMPAGRPPTT